LTGDEGFLLEIEAFNLCAQLESVRVGRDVASHIIILAVIHLSI
jgi:hypothetical protein